MRKGQAKIVEEMNRNGYGEAVVEYFKNSVETISTLNKRKWFARLFDRKELSDSSLKTVSELFEAAQKLDRMFDDDYTWIWDLYWHNVKKSIAEFYEYYDLIQECTPTDRRSYSKIYRNIQNASDTRWVVQQYKSPILLDRYMQILSTISVPYYYKNNLNLLVQYANFCTENTDFHVDKIKEFYKRNYPVEVAQKYSFDIMNLYNHRLKPFMAAFEGKKEKTIILTPEFNDRDISLILKATKEKKITLNSVCFQFYGVQCYERFAVQLIFKKSNSFVIEPLSDKEQTHKIRMCSTTSRPIKIVYFGDTNTMMKEVKDRLVPMTVKDLCFLAGFYGEMYSKIFLPWLQHQWQEYPFFEDLAKLAESFRTRNYIEYVPPLSLKECENYHNWNEAMNAHYKKKLPINWNKHDIETAFFVYKNLSKVTEESKKVLMSCLNTPYDNLSLSLNEILFNRLEKESFFLVSRINNEGQVTKEKRQLSEEEVRHYISDYISMCKLLHKKISLIFKSFSTLKAAHDRISMLYTGKHTPIIKVPKNTVFKNLNKLLPADEFEWIKTRKRIIREGTEMHHCIASYADMINRDKCAIYSFISRETNERYTLQFECKRGGYVLKQMKTICNGVGVTKDVEYVKSLVKNSASACQGKETCPTF